MMNSENNENNLTVKDGTDEMPPMGTIDENTTTTSFVKPTVTSSTTSQSTSPFLLIALFVGIVVVVELGAIIGLQANNNNKTTSSMPATVVLNGVTSSDPSSSSGMTTTPPATPTVLAKNTTQAFSNVPNNNFFDIPTLFSQGENICEGKNPALPNIDCVHEMVGPQAGGNVTKGYKGSFEVDHDPILTPYWMNSMCPVNVHWHLGTEHYSAGEYDEFGTGPNGNVVGPAGKLDGGKQPGYRCRHYDANDPKFTTAYDWKHCVNMIVGETYEVHWPHSAAGACGTINQYQTPFADGVFCRDNVLTNVPAQVGVQGQVFVVVNDESYFYPDLIRSWVVDGDMGQDIHYYTGSTTGTSRNNEVCSQYSPITWQVDRKCHLISASSFDKLCYDMKLQRDDMSSDLYPHGSRILVADNLTANNGQRRLGGHFHAHDHDHDHEHDHEYYFNNIW